MQRIFFRNLVFLVTLNVLIKPVWIFGIDRGVQNTVGSASYGIYFVLMNLSMLTQILLDMGMSNFNNRSIAQHEHLLSNYLSNIFGIKLVLAAIYFFITLFIAFFLNFSWYELHLLFLICINQALASLIVYVRSNISALHHFVIDSILSVTDKAIMIIACGALLWLPGFNEQFRVEWFVIAQTVAYIITLIAAFFFVIHFSGKFRLRFSFSFATSIVRQALPFAMLIALMALYSRTDGVFIEKLLPQTGEHEAGIYASAFRLLDAFNQFGFLFAALLLPIFSRMLASRQNVSTLVSSSFTLIYTGSIIACIAISFFADPIMHLLYHEATAYSSHILSVLIFGLLGYSSIYVFGTLLTANGSLKELCIISFIGVMLNWSMNFFLIPILNAYGSALAASVTEIFVAIVTIIIGYKKLKLTVNFKQLIRLLIFSLLLIAVFYGVKKLPILWMMQMSIAVFLSMLLAFALQLIRFRQIRSLLSST